jgi:beta-lactamase regulating signal transducer with metallopeptidase domain
VLPANYATAFDASIMRAILLHELAHLSRRDCWWKLLSETMCAVLWMQPLLWVLCRRLEQASESWCDEVVVNGGCAPRSYASFLLELSERMVSKPAEHAASVGMMPFRSNLGQRIQRIMSSSRNGVLPVSRTTRIVIVAGMTGALTSVLVLVAVDQRMLYMLTNNKRRCPGRSKFHPVSVATQLLSGEYSTRMENLRQG